MQPSFRSLVMFAASTMLAGAASACELCAIYRAADAKGDFGSGITATLAGQFVPNRTVLFNGTEFKRPGSDYLDRTTIHAVVGWNFAEDFGVSLNLPEVIQSYQRFEFENGIRPRTLRATETGLGDAALVGRWRFLNHSAMQWGGSLNLLAGVKMPTGDVGHLENQEAQVRAYEAIVGPGHNHDALGQVQSGVHPANLSLGSGSVDGIVGLTGSLRWKRAFLNAQFQYYLRSEGAGEYRNGDDLIASGGPGFFVYVTPKSSLSLQGNVTYETSGSDELLGRRSVHTGMTAWYGGPVINFTWKSRFSALASVDVPLAIANRGFQNVPDYRANLSLTCRF